MQHFELSTFSAKECHDCFLGAAITGQEPKSLFWHDNPFGKAHSTQLICNIPVQHMTPLMLSCESQ